MTAPLISVSAAAVALGVSDWTVRRMIRDHQLPGVRVRRRWRVRPEDVERAKTPADRPLVAAGAPVVGVPSTQASEALRAFPGFSWNRASAAHPR